MSLINAHSFNEYCKMNLQRNPWMYLHTVSASIRATILSLFVALAGPGCAFEFEDQIKGENDEDEIDEDGAFDFESDDDVFEEYGVDDYEATLGGLSQGQGPEPRCDICPNGYFPIQHQVLAFRYLDGNPTCQETYWLGRNGFIPDRICLPLRDWVEDVCCVGAVETPVPHRPLYRLRRNNDHMFSRDPFEGWRVGYRNEGAKFLITGWNLGQQTAPLVRCRIGGDHFLRVFECGPDYNYEGVMGYVYRHPKQGRRALKRCHSRQTGDHFSTIDENECLRAGYRVEGTLGYVYPLNAPEVWTLP